VTEAKSYKETVNLPKTDFDMRANALKREPEIDKFWKDHQIYEKLAENNPHDLFVLHDGPPYANGSLHIGHALNKILKDIINKYKLLQGYKVRYVPGWDCHGLPIELKVLQNMKQEERETLTPLALRQKARDFAQKTQKEQSTAFQRFGIWGDWEHPYMTLTPEYEAAQIAVFGKMALKGYIYRGLKPVHWSPSSQTALAEAELEYPEGHVSRSVFAAFPIIKASTPVLEPFIPNLAVAIWTTTPWTLPGNLAVALNPELDYSVVEANSRLCQYQYLIVATDLVATLTETFNTPLTIKATVKGKDLEHTVYRHPLFARESEILIGGDYVTTESGTGLVHTAPGHGQEDYLVGQRYNLPILSPVDDKGNFTSEAGVFAGLNVLKDANEAIIQALGEQGALLKEEPYQHKYPYDWRTKKPTIFRATEQWFASVLGFKEEALAAIKTVKWIPSQGENRITPMIGDRSDWCISRQRHWGVPIPVFYDEETNEPLLTEESINHVQGIIAEKGSDAWWELPLEELLPPSVRNNGRTYRRGTDTMDVWFDSGSSWAAVANTRPELKYPVDMYLEGSDQHRGWFQSSLLTSVAANGIAPYQTVLTHGFVLDENGRKMSKSLGNVVDPATIINGGKDQKKEPGYGADILRLWVSSVDYSADVPIGQNILKQLVDVRNKIRNTARFLLGSLEGFDPSIDAISYQDLPELDKYMLHRIGEVFTEVTEAFETFQFSRFFQVVQNFCVVDLSTFYLDIAKDRLYISDTNAFRRRSCQTVLALALENLTKAIAPVLSYLAEDIWQYLPYNTPYSSVFESGWVVVKPEWNKPELTSKWTKIRQIRTEVNKVMENARTQKVIGSSLDAKVLLYLADADFKQELEAFNLGDSLSGNLVDELRYFFLASQVELVDSKASIETANYTGESELVSVGIVKADGQKCDRCWNYSTHVGEFKEDPTICERCNSALKGEF
jgi:isoleucyl-tRNA synthetase